MLIVSEKCGHYERAQDENYQGHKCPIDENVVLIKNLTHLFLLVLPLQSILLGFLLGGFAFELTGHHN